MTGPDRQLGDGVERSRLAPYAVFDGASRGRRHPEAVPAGEPPFEHDRDRILHCTAFRRLMHKTQVFVADAGDHFRTRLTHTLEVAAQAGHLARRLRLNEPLAVAVAFAHDLGHPPFGHAGEVTLADLMKDHGGFEHNSQSLRVVDYLEHPYPAFRGLNLSFEVRESIIKHRTRYDRPDDAGALGDETRPLLEAGPMPPLEGQVANLADSVAYTLHDIEDALVGCGLTEDALNQCTIWQDAARRVRRANPTDPLHAIRRPILDAIARRLIEDAAEASLRRIRDAGAGEPDAVRHHEEDLIAFSDEVAAGVDQLQAMLARCVYRNDRVVRMDEEADRIIRALFAAYLDDPGRLPERFARRIPEMGPHRVICDYVAGMTDRFCRHEHGRLAGSTGHG